MAGRRFGVRWAASKGGGAQLRRGRALIEDVRIHYRGPALATDPYDCYVAERGTERSAGLSVDKLIPGRLVSAGESVLALGWEGDVAPAMVAELLGMFEIGEAPKAWYDTLGVPVSGRDKATIEITYAFVYGERSARHLDSRGRAGR